jgi:uncharacterized protein
MRQEATPMQFHLLAKPTGSACNLDCGYCFYLAKADLYPDSRFRMSDEVLERYLRQLFAAHAGEREVSVSWQGGEPALMGLPFFERAVALAAMLAEPGQVVRHAIQTNGLLLDDAWCAFFKRNSILVGLSMDGPRPLHDAYRVDKGGRGSFDGAMRAWKLLRRHGVDVNILCAVHAGNASRPREVYRFFRDELRARYLQFIPIVERSGDRARPVTRRTVDPELFGRFLIAVFDEWMRHDVGKVFVQTFDAVLGNFVGMPSLCIFARDCGAYPVLEHNGDVYSCDHFVDPDHALGNIADSTIAEMIGSPRQRAFGAAKGALPAVCRECEFLFACEGECPRNRFMPAPGGERGLNYLCAGYKSFFRHVTRPMTVMAELLRAGRPPSEVTHYVGSAREASSAR